MVVYLELIKKDFSLLGKQMAGYGALMLTAVAIMALPIELAAHFGSIVLAFAMVAFYCSLVMKTVISERKEKNHLLLLTLPVTAGQLARVKLASVLLIFFSLWVPIFALVTVFLLNSPHWPGVAVAFYTAGFILYLPAFAVILAAAFVTLSESLTILAFVVSNMVVAIFLNYLPKVEFMQQAFAQGPLAEVGILWPSQVSTLLVVEVGAFVALLVLCLIAAGRIRSD